jgi:hypothetical protein
MTRRLAILLPFLAATLALADEPPSAPWEAPAPGGPAAASGATAPAATTFDAAFPDIEALRLDAARAAKLAAMPADKRNAILEEDWAALKPHQQAQVRYAGQHFRENGSAATARSVALLVLGPPQEIRSDASHAWTGQAVEKIDDLRALLERLKSGTPSAATMTVTGSHPTELWIYPGKTMNELRVVTFVDDDGDGTLRFASDTSVPAAQAPSTAQAVEPPGDLYPPLETAAVIEELPKLTKPGLPLTVSQEFFKAGAAGRTFTRFVVSVDPEDVETELSLDPATFGAAAQAWVRVEQGGAPAWQGNVKLADVGATASKPWLLELSVPLAPGTYDVTAQVADATGNGGQKKASVTVPAYGGKLSFSTPVIARVDSDAGPPEASASATDELQPFQIGHYIVRPAQGAFKKGERVAFVVQVYDAPKATIEFKLFRDGTWQSSLDTVEITLPSTQMTVQEITNEFTPANYEMRAVIRNPADPSQETTAVFPFRVKG